MARGYWRNWEGRDGAESYPGQKVPTRPAVCPWCGWRWNTRVPVHPVCPKCQLNTYTAAKRHALPPKEANDNLLHRTIIMRDYYRKHPEELKK